MVMINMKEPFYFVTADGASTFLLRQQLLIGFDRQSVLLQLVLAMCLTGAEPTRIGLPELFLQFCRELIEIPDLFTCRASSFHAYL